MSKIILNETLKLPDKILTRVYQHRRAGYGPYKVAEKIRDEGLGDYTKSVLDKHADHPDNVEKFSKTGEYHPKNERTVSSVLKKKSQDINVEDAFKMRKKGISDPEIGKRYGTVGVTIKRLLDKTHKDHPSYTPSAHSERPKNPEELRNSIISMHGTINKETGDYHTYGSIADAHGVTRSKVAGILSRAKGNNNMESIKDRIKNILNESNWMQRRQLAISRVRSVKGKEAEENVPLTDTRETFRNLVMRHMDDIHTKLLSDENLHPEAKKEIEAHVKRMGQTISKF